MQDNDVQRSGLTRRGLLGGMGIASLALVSSPALAQETVDLQVPGGPSRRMITTSYPQKGRMILHQLLLAVRQDEARRVRCDDSGVDQAFEDQSGGVGRTACKIVCRTVFWTLVLLSRSRFSLSVRTQAKRIIS